MLFGAWVELGFAGFLVAFGLLTRVAAFIASGEMAVACFMAHFGANKFSPSETMVNRR